jgi:membrane associated rhomboid family serine protease
MNPVTTPWDYVMRWYGTRAAVWVELACWVGVLAVGVVVSSPGVIAVGAVGLVIRLLTAILVRVVIRRGGSR